MRADADFFCLSPGDIQFEKNEVSLSNQLERSYYHGVNLFVFCIFVFKKKNHYCLHFANRMEGN